MGTFFVLALSEPLQAFSQAAPRRLAGERGFCLVGVIFLCCFGAFLSFFGPRGANGTKTSPSGQKGAKNFKKFKKTTPFWRHFLMFSGIFRCHILVAFLVCSRRAFLQLLVNMRLILEPFGSPLGHFFGVGGICGN